MPKIIYWDTPPGANERAQAAGQGQPFWDGSLTAARPAVRLATLEPGYWKLDGKSALYSDSGNTEGFCSRTLSDENGCFAQPVRLSLLLEVPCTATGLSFVFDPETGEYCSGLEAKWYRGTALVAEQDFLPKHSEALLSLVVEDFDRVELTFFGTSAPRRFLRIRQILLGQVHRFGPEELQAVTISREADPSGTRLPGGRAEFTLVEQQGRSMVFQPGQKITVEQNGRNLGCFYLKESSRTHRNIYQISCHDAIGVLTDSNTLGGIYRRTGFGTLAREILAGQFRAEIAPELENLPISGYLPPSSKRDALLQLCFAAGARVMAAGEALQFALPQKKSSVAVTGEHIFRGGVCRQQMPVSRVTVTAHRYTEAQEKETLHQAVLEPGEYLLTWREPHHSYEVSGALLLESGAGYASVRVTESRTVIVEGKKYRHDTTEFVGSNLGSVVQENCKRVDNATLLSEELAPAALERLMDYFRNTEILEQEVVGAEIEPGDMITIEKPFEGVLVGTVSGAELRLTAGAVIGRLTVEGHTLDLQVESPESGEQECGEERP